MTGRPVSAPHPPHSLDHVLAETARLLGRPCAPDGDLFDAGATSMTAIRLATRLARLCGRPVTAADVLQTRTPEGLARRIDTLPVQAAPPASGTAPAGPPILPESLLHFWTLADALPDQQEALAPLLFRLSGDVDPALLRSALDAVVARHDALRSLFVRAGADVRVVVLPPEEVTGLLMVEPGPPAEPAAALAEARRWLLEPFGLAGSVPIRARLIATADGGHLLAVVIHHIVLDGWSGELFCRDLVRAHDALRAGRPAFADPAPSFWAVLAEQSRLHVAEYADAMAYWSDLVRGVPAVRFPGAAGIAPVGPIEEIDLPLSAELLARAGKAASTVGGTATAVLLAAYVRTLRDYLGTDDLAVSVPLAGRFVADSAETLGCFAGGVALRLPTDDDPVSLVAAAAGQLDRATRSPLLTPTRIHSGPPPGAQRHPLAQVYFAPQDSMPARLDFDGMRADTVPMRPDAWYAEVALQIRPFPAVGGMLRYRTDVIPPERARRLVEDWSADVGFLTDRLAV